MKTRLFKIKILLWTEYSGAEGIEADSPFGTYSVFWTGDSWACKIPGNVTQTLHADKLKAKEEAQSNFESRMSAGLVEFLVVENYITQMGKNGLNITSPFTYDEIVAIEGQDDEDAMNFFDQLPLGEPTA